MMKKGRKILLSLLALIFVVIVDYPIFMVISNSFKTQAEIIERTSFLPKSLYLGNYGYLIGQTPFFTFMRNSAIVSIIVSLLTIVCAALAGYAISRYRRRSLNIFSQSLYFVQMFPGVLIIIPLFFTFSIIGLVDSLATIIIVYTAGNLSYAIWLFKGYFDSIPLELEEAAFIDGASQTGVIRRIVLPLSGPGIGAVTIFTFLAAWNEYLAASTFLKSEMHRTVPVGMSEFVLQYGGNWGHLMAASALAMLPSIVVFILLQKYFVSGGLAGGVKG